MIFPIFGALVLLGIVAFTQGGRKGGHRPIWHWIALVLSTIVVIAITALWVGEYEFESGQRHQISN